MKDGYVSYQEGDTLLEGYLARDKAGKEKRPGILVIHEWWGVTDNIKRKADQLAELGYVAFAADMYGKGVATQNQEEAAELSGRLKGTALLRQRANAGLGVLLNHPQVDTDRIAAIGFCFGGSTVLELAYSGVSLNGVVSFHGGLPLPGEKDPRPLKASVLILHGAMDPLTTPGDIMAFQRTMGRMAADWQMIYYGDAVHSFTNPDADASDMKGVAYNARASVRSWEHMNLFFNEIFQK